MNRNARIFFKEGENSAVENALREVRTNLHFISERDKNKTYVVTSTIPGEGKSFIATNYAMSLSVTGKKVLLIDCDIRKPRVSERFGLEVKYGLKEYLYNQKSLEEIIVRDVEKNLDIISTRHMTENVTELFFGEKIKELIENFKGKYDAIILDTPPMMVATDAAVIAKYSDGVIFVVAYDKVSKNELEHCKKVLDCAGISIKGFIVNKVNKRGLSYSNYSHYNHGYRYYKEYYSEKKDEVKPKNLLKKIKDVYIRHLQGE